MVYQLNINDLSVHVDVVDWAMADFAVPEQFISNFNNNNNNNNNRRMATNEKRESWTYQKGELHCLLRQCKNRL